MQPDSKAIERILHAALEEDIGQGDITSELVIPETEQIRVAFVTREGIVVCGLSVLERLFAMLEGVRLQAAAKEGEVLAAGGIIARAEGNARIILKAERVALNLLQRMCAIATQSRRYAEAVQGTGATVLDTRKTTPGLRVIEKYAVATGGCTNHRMRLDDGILIKDNHVHLCGGVKQAVERAKRNYKGNLPIHLECDTLAQVEEALAAGTPHILLDNMDIPTLKQAVDFVKGRAKLEASGGVTIKNIRAIAETGVDFISVGALTHSVPAVDIGLDVE